MNIKKIFTKILFGAERNTMHQTEIINTGYSGRVVAKVISSYDSKEMYHCSADEMPGTCPFCHYTVEKVPNLEYKNNYEKDIYTTYDGFIIVSEKFKRFCEMQNFNDLTFIKLTKSPGHYYFMPTTFFSIDTEHTIIKHEGAQCPRCGGYPWVGTGGHRIFSKYSLALAEQQNFIQRLSGFYGDKNRKFPIIVIGLKTARLLEDYGIKAPEDYCLDDVLFFEDKKPTELA